jgi:hypothetical protein
MTREQALALAKARRLRAESEAAAQPQGAEAMRARGLTSPDPANANAAALSGMFPTSLPEQVGSGTAEGIGNMLGFPVDMMTKGVNAVGGLAGMSPIETPFGGSETMKAGLGSFISDVQPQTAAQRIGRRVGQDVGAGAVAGPLAGVGSLGGMALNAAADTASGLVGGLTAEATDDPNINAIVSILAGMGPVAASRAARPGPQAPTNDALRTRETALWDQVRDSRMRLTPNASQELKGNVSAKAYDMRMKPSLHGPEAPAAIDEVWGLPDRPTLWDIEEARRFIGENTPAGFDRKSTARITTGLKGEIDAYLDNIKHPDAGVARDARDVSRRRIASEKLDRSIDKAERRASASGTGGNTMNTPRQNLNRILDSPRESASFTKGEQGEMREIIDGKGGTNAARRLAGLSPDRGTLPLAGNVASFTAGMMTGDPLVAALSATPGAIGFAAKKIGERLTDAQINRLSEVIRNGGVSVPQKALTEGEKAVLSALLSTQLANQAQ